MSAPSPVAGRSRVLEWSGAVVVGFLLALALACYQNPVG